MGKVKQIDDKSYYREMAKLQIELVKLQEWVKQKGLKIVVVFEGRDAAGKGGVIKRITEKLNPRICKVVALGVPTEKEKSQWYFQRYVPFLPAKGEIVLFDRSWYNRAGVEKVMGFCTDDEYEEFLRSCPEFEKMLVRSGIILVKYWFSVSDDEQENRFQARIVDPTKRWKISPMDLESRKYWVEYSKAKDEMMDYTDIKQAPWFVVPSDIKKHARLNCISHLLSTIYYEDIPREQLVLPERQENDFYVRPPMEEQTFVPDYVENLLLKMDKNKSKDEDSKKDEKEKVKKAKKDKDDKEKAKKDKDKKDKNDKNKKDKDKKDKDKKDKDKNDIDKKDIDKKDLDENEVNESDIINEIIEEEVKDKMLEEEVTEEDNEE